jgi:guanosine-3',5'-bis(diphosphate) 3'-pyrophosphohydrolase
MSKEAPEITSEAPSPGSLEKFIQNSSFLTKAYNLAEKAHKGKLRAEGIPYFTHCVAVAQILYEEWGITDPEKIAVGLLHDTVEDTETTLEELESEFGSRVAFWVDGVSKFRSERGELNDKSKEEKDRETVRKVFSKNLIDPFVGVAKLADRLHNMRTLGFMPVVNQIAKANETKGYAKLAESLGMWEVMKELENLSMKYSCPEDYEKYSDILKRDPRTQEEFVSWLNSTLETIAADASIESRVETRLISLSKLKNKKGKYLTEKINDLISFRVIVTGTGGKDSRNNVYKMLGALRQNFVDVEDSDRFDDFYSKPRDNDYSAIQLTLDFPQGATEIAITSEDKEEFNKWGVVSLIRKGNSELAKHALKLVFTVTQEVKFFPSKVTGLDFAYSISRALGARADHVLIDGIRYPVSTVLPNGSEVEIELGKPRIAPRKELREYCLPATRRIIDEQLTEEEKWKLEMKGKEAIRKMISQRGLIDLTDLLKIDKYKANLEYLLFILGCKNSIEDLYYKVGSGVMNPTDLEKHFNDAEITKKHLGLTSILIEGIDGPGITSLVSSKVSELGGNIGPMTNRPHDEGKDITFTLRMVVENLSPKNEARLNKFFQNDSRITKVIVV